MAKMIKESDVDVNFISECGVPEILDFPGAKGMHVNAIDVTENGGLGGVIVFVPGMTVRNLFPRVGGK